MEPADPMAVWCCPSRLYLLWGRNPLVSFLAATYNALSLRISPDYPNSRMQPGCLATSETDRPSVWNVGIYGEQSIDTPRPTPEKPVCLVMDRDLLCLPRAVQCCFDRGKSGRGRGLCGARTGSEEGGPPTDHQRSTDFFATLPT